MAEHQNAARASCMGGVEFKPGPAKSYTTVCHRFNICLHTSSCVLPWHYAAGMGTRYTLRRNATSIMKGLIWFNGSRHACWNWKINFRDIWPKLQRTGHRCFV